MSAGVSTLAGWLLVSRVRSRLASTVGPRSGASPTELVTLSAFLFGVIVRSTPCFTEWGRVTLSTPPTPTAAAFLFLVRIASSVTLATPVPSMLCPFGFLGSVMLATPVGLTASSVSSGGYVASVL